MPFSCEQLRVKNSLSSSTVEEATSTCGFEMGTAGKERNHTDATSQGTGREIPKPPQLVYTGWSKPPNPPPSWTKPSQYALRENIPWTTQSPLDVLLALTVHGEVDGLLAGESVVGDGHLHLVGAFIRQLQGADEQRAVLQHPDAVAVIGPEVSDDLGADGLDDGDGFVPLQLPLDHGLVGAGAGVAHRQQRRLARRAAHQRRGAGDVHPCQQTLGAWGEKVGCQA